MHIIPLTTAPCGGQRRRAQSVGAKLGQGESSAWPYFAIRLYADDWSDSFPVLPQLNPYPNGVGAYYKQLVKGYLGLSGAASSNEQVFVCPSDPTFHTQ